MRPQLGLGFSGRPAVAASPFPGPELVVNGDFAAGATGWTVSNISGASSITGGAMVFNDAADDGDILSQVLAPTPGFGYRFVYTVVARTGGSCRFSFGGVFGTLRNTVGTFSEDIIAVSNANINLFGASPQLTIDNISVKRIS